MTFFISLISTLIIGFVTIFILFYLYIQYQYTYWKRRNVYYEKPQFPFGNMKGIAKTRSFGQIMKGIYDNHKGEKVVGMYGIFGNQALVIRDLDMIKTILIKDFSSFMNRGFFEDTLKYDPLTGHLFFLEGRKWRNLRIKLTPTFTSGKMKMMFPTLLKCGEDLQEFLQKTAENEDVIDVKEILSKFTMDVIACAFGLDLKCFQNPNTEFKAMGDAIFKPNFIQIMRNNFRFAAPKVASLLRIRLTPKKIENFFIGVVRDTIEYREKNNVHRNDFMQLLIELKNKGKIESADHVAEDPDYESTFTIERAAAQAFVFFVAGFETSSTTLQFCLFELALNQKIQEKTREEIDRVMKKHDGKITYDGLHEMEYLDQVVSETLRKYPAVPNLVRSCTKDYHFEEINATLEKNTRVLLPVLALHYDPEYWPEPEKFDPDRFLPENKESRNQICYLPFGDGPRNCIGNRFGLMQTKTGLCIILSRFKVQLSEKTKLPLEWDPRTAITGIKNKIYLKISKR